MGPVTEPVSITELVMASAVASHDEGSLYLRARVPLGPIGIAPVHGQNCHPVSYAIETICDVPAQFSPNQVGSRRNNFPLAASVSK